MFSLRDICPDDAEAVVNLLNPIIEVGCYTAFTSPFTVAAELEFIENFPARGNFLGAFHDHELLGFQVVTPPGQLPAFDHVGEIGTYVRLESHRLGVAGKLYEATFGQTRIKGYEKLVAWVRADNEAELRSYTRYGFQRVGVAKKHAKIGGRYIDEVLLEHHLSS